MHEKRRPDSVDQGNGRCFWVYQSGKKLLGDVAVEFEP